MASEAAKPEPEWTTLGELRPGLFTDKNGSLAEKMADGDDNRLKTCRVRVDNGLTHNFPQEMQVRPAKMAPRKKRPKAE